MEIGIVGLPNVGKSSLFNALSNAGASVSNYPFTTIEPNVGVVPVPDKRLKRLEEIFKPKKVMPSVVRFVDIAGLVKGASEGAGLGNKFLANIREVDAILHVVRHFADPDVVHSLGQVDPLRDVEIIETELILSDLQSIDKQIEKNDTNIKAGKKDAVERAVHLQALKKGLSEGKAARELGIPPEALKEFSLLSGKPTLYVANTDEGNIGKNENSPLAKLAKERGLPFIDLSVKIEAEIIQLPPEEREEFLKSLNLTQSGMDRVAVAAQKLLKLMSFFTAGPQEVRAWTIHEGDRAPQAAGKIHSDMEKGFIRADIYSFSDMDRLGSEAAIKEQGLLRSEGKDYVMRDGDVVFFKFSK